jgi:hypothetical protein
MDTWLLVVGGILFTLLAVYGYIRYVDHLPSNRDVD